MRRKTVKLYNNDEDERQNEGQGGCVEDGGDTIAFMNRRGGDSVATQPRDGNDREGRVTRAHVVVARK